MRKTKRRYATTASGGRRSAKSTAASATGLKLRVSRHQKEHRIQPGNHNGKEQRVEAVEKAAMPGHDAAAVFHARHALQLTFEQVAASAANGRQRSDGSDMRNRQQPP